jgi:hypothetical protein
MISKKKSNEQINTDRHKHTTTDRHQRQIQTDTITQQQTNTIDKQTDKQTDQQLATTTLPNAYKATIAHQDNTTLALIKKRIKHELLRRQIIGNEEKPCITFFCCEIR